MNLPRLFWWLVATILLLAMIGLMHPQQLPVTVYKLSLITMAGVIGYWLDRSLFPYARPDAFLVKSTPAEAPVCDMDIEGDCKIIPWEEITGDGLVLSAAMLRRAVIVGCAMLAIGLGA